MVMKAVCFRAKHFSFLLAISLFLGQSLFAAGSGTIKGKILDSLTGDPLIGSNVVVVGTNLVASSNIDGEFIIHDVPSGENTLKISYIGYPAITEQVVVPEGGVVEKVFQLIPHPIDGTVCRVVPNHKGQNEAINQQLASTNVTNVVSSEKMHELPDATIAESIGRLPGVTLNRQNGEANQVIIRGMSPQFNNVTIEGVPMVSTSGGLAATHDNSGSSNYADRSIDLSVMSDDLIDGVELSKSLMPNMDANSIGGTVNLTLKEAPTGFHSELQVNGGYNDLTTKWKNYKAIGRISDRFFNDAIGVRVQLNAEDRALPSQQFNAGYSGLTTNTAGTAIGGVVYSLLQNTNNAGLTVDNLDRKRYGGNVVLDYESDFVDIKFFNVYAQKKDHDTQYDFTTDFNPLDYIGGAGLLNSLYKIQDFTTEERMHSLQAKFKFAGTELDASYSYTKSDYNNSVYGFYFVQSMITNPYAANQKVYGQPSALMAISYPLLNGNNWYMPDIDYAQNFLNDNTNDVRIDYHIPFKVSDYLSGIISLGGKYHEFDRVTSGMSEYYDMHWNGTGRSRGSLFGLFLAEYYPTPYDMEIDVNQGPSARNFTQYGYTAPTFLKGVYKLPSFGYDMGLLYSIGQKWLAFLPLSFVGWGRAWSVDVPQNYNSDMEAKEKLGASYVMGQFNVGSNLSLVAGVRWEQIKGFYSAYTLFSNGSNQNGLNGVPAWRTIDAVHADYFPSVNLKYNATENVQLFGAYYTSASRPNFSDLAPLVDYSITGNNINATGNPYLGPALVNNFDIGGSVFSNEIGLFTADFFYKEIKDLPYDMPGYMPSSYGRSSIVGAPSDMLNRLPPVAYFDTAYLNQTANQNTSCIIPINNPENAYARGIELSWQTHFWYLPGVLSGLVLDLNVAFMSSNALYPYFNNATIKKDSTLSNGSWKYTFYNAYLTRSGSLLNMPDAVYNAIIGWNYLGFSSRVSFKYQGKTLANIYPTYSAADTYYKGTSLVDIILKQKLTDHLSIFADFVNIGSHIDSYYMNTSAGVLTTSQQMYGFSAQFGASYIF
jgi:TonB-dependent receptor